MSFGGPGGSQGVLYSRQRCVLMVEQVDHPTRCCPGWRIEQRGDFTGWDGMQQPGTRTWRFGPVIVARRSRTAI